MEYRYRLKLYHAKIKLLGAEAKSAKKEVKGALEIYQKSLKPAGAAEEVRMANRILATSITP